MATQAKSAAPRRKRAKIHHRRELKIKTGQAKAEINITPLVDVVLVLLIIFMVITPMLHRGVKIELPETSHHEKKQDTGEQLVVSVRGDGVYIETERLEGERLMDKLRTELKTASRPVHVRADKALNYGDVRKVLEKIHEAGAITVGLGTDEKKE